MNFDLNYNEQKRKKTLKWTNQIDQPNDPFLDLHHSCHVLVNFNYNF